MAAGRVHDRKIRVEIDDKEGVAKDTQMTYDRRTSAWQEDRCGDRCHRRGAKDTQTDKYTDIDIWTPGQVHDRKIDVEIDDKEGGAIDTQTDKYIDIDISPHDVCMTTRLRFL
jgi:hypothetical protein